jgi:hypothetical protein
MSDFDYYNDLKKKKIETNVHILQALDLLGLVAKDRNEIPSRFFRLGLASET